MILVTGANSLLGTNCVIALLERGYKVRVLVRRSNEVLEQAQVIMGNVDSEADLRHAMTGCRAVVHIAASTAQDLLRIEDYSFNWQCAARVATMARELSLDRMIFVSTANTIGNGTLANPAAEDTPMSKPFVGSLYAQSKVRAESEVLRAFERVVIINPGFMIGAYDSKPSSGEIIMRCVGKRLVFTPRGGKSFVHVDDVAAAICGAVEGGIFGERYLASGVSMSFKDFYTLLRQCTSMKFSCVIIPSFVLIAAGYVGNLIRKLGIRTPVTVDNMRILCTQEYYDNSKASDELLMSQSNIDDAVKEAVAWFTENGMISD